jgi:di/tricarboxylate transporter
VGVLSCDWPVDERHQQQYERRVADPGPASIAQSIGMNAFAFVLAVTFVASTTFMTLVGSQTNLFVCGLGGYTFSGFLRVGAPLQFLLSIVTVLGIAFF